MPWAAVFSFIAPLFMLFYLFIYSFKVVVMRFIQALVLCSVVILAAGCATVSAPKPHGGKPQVPAVSMQSCDNIISYYSSIGPACYPIGKSAKKYFNSLKFRQCIWRQITRFLSFYAKASGSCKAALNHNPHHPVNAAIAEFESMKANGLNAKMSFNEFEQWLLTQPREVDLPSTEACFYLSRMLFSQGVSNAFDLEELLKINKSDRDLLQAASCSQQAHIANYCAAQDLVKRLGQSECLSGPGPKIMLPPK